MDRGPAAKAGGVEAEAVAEGVFGEFVDGESQVMPRPDEVRDLTETNLASLSSAYFKTVLAFIMSPGIYLEGDRVGRLGGDWSGAGN